MRTLFALLVGCIISTSAIASGSDDWRQARIRPQDPRLGDLLRTGADRSPTLRNIVERLEAGHLIVYVSQSPTMRSSLAGKLTWMTKTGPFRYVRVTINPEQSADQMIATLAHELQHALEVGGDESVVDQRSLIGLYQRIGRPSTSGVNAGFETAAAQATGLQVRRELVASTAAASASRAGDNAQL
jgi:hypothetical protein